MDPYEFKEKDGLAPIGPFRRNASAVRIGVRPVDPLLEDSISEVSEHLRDWYGRVGGSASLAIRCVDGFFVNIQGTDPFKKGPQLVRVIDFDPIKGFFLTIGKDAPDPEAGLFWYVFKVFEGTGTVLTLRDKEGRNPDIPNEGSALHARRMDIIRAWKAENVLKEDHITRIRCSGLEELGAIIDQELGAQSMSHRS